MIDKSALAKIIDENLEIRLSRILLNKGFASDSARLLFRFITSIFELCPPEIISWKFRVVYFSEPSRIMDSKVIHIHDLLNSFYGDCTIIMLSENTCILESYEMDIAEYTNICYTYFSPLNEQLQIDEEVVQLPPYYDSTISSIFFRPIYRELDEALAAYDIHFARNCVCNILKEMWLDETRKEFRKKPERYMRDSLWQYLKAVLRNHTIKREQNVDSTHPVDIKVTWPMANNTALIEVKWLGDSGNIHHRDSRANTGAKQLIDYLFSSCSEEPDKNFVGYLTVFDGRRGKRSNNQYENIEIKYDDEYLSHSKMKYYRFYLAENIP